MKTNKTALFAFKGNPICFVHVLLNAIDLHEKEGEVKIILEGEATRLIIELRKPEHPLHALYAKAKELDLIDAVCRACAIKMGALETAEAEGFRIADDMAGHAGMAPYIEQDYEIITL
ncbi:MAG: cytoplasmic protein [Desulfobacterales bacterium SG8_35]|nr:MAG: cytoplasmic protein [Desulfobacterales bacterium SG8_35]